MNLPIWFPPIPRGARVVVRATAGSTYTYLVRLLGIRPDIQPITNMMAVLGGYVAVPFPQANVSVSVGWTTVMANLPFPFSPLVVAGVGNGGRLDLGWGDTGKEYQIWSAVMTGNNSSEAISACAATAIPKPAPAGSRFTASCDNASESIQVAGYRRDYPIIMPTF